MPRTPFTRLRATSSSFRRAPAATSLPSTIGSRAYPITSLTFVERSANMIDVALKAPATTHLVDAFKRGRRRIRFYPVDAHSLAIFNDDSFDTVVDTFGLCSYQDPVRVLLEMQRVCKPDGRIVLLQHGRADYAFPKPAIGYLRRQARLEVGVLVNRDILELLKRSKLRVTYLNRCISVPRTTWWRPPIKSFEGGIRLAMVLCVGGWAAWLNLIDKASIVVTRHMLPMRPRSVVRLWA
ncbi:hypothetical protein L0F63_005917 [Massospora cicadina]|nr:hypothetical protein L0F63_005917 [Massospora cicadina]